MVKFWWDADKAAKTAVKQKKKIDTHGIRFSYQSDMLFITLPSGRRLAYVKPRIGENRFGSECVTYEGIGATKNGNASNPRPVSGWRTSPRPWQGTSYITPCRHFAPPMLSCISMTRSSTKGGQTCVTRYCLRTDEACAALGGWASASLRRL